jgi:UDP-glucose:(heptosyl)LPS alpha-1,3-glucosyltransferase
LRPTLRVLLWLDRQVFRRSPGVVTVSVSGKVEDDFRRAYPEVTFRFERLHNAIDLHGFHDRDRAERSRELRARFSISEREKVALFVGHSFRLKGLPHALEVIRRAALWHLVVAGRDEKASFLRQARRLGVGERIHFAGSVVDPRSLYAGCEALLQPTHYDPCSLATLESIACGTPVVTTAQNGAGELLGKGGAGLVVADPSREEEMAAGLLELQERWGDYHALASSMAPSLSWPDHLSRLEEILSRTLKTLQNGPDPAAKEGKLKYNHGVHQSSQEE